MSKAHHFGGEKVNIYLTDIFKHQLLQSIYRLTRDTARPELEDVEFRLNAYRQKNVVVVVIELLGTTVL